MAITKISNSGVNGSKYDIVSADNYYMEPIATTLVGAGGAAAVTFSNIPNTYKHLQVRGIATFASGTNAIILQANGDTGSNYAWHQMYGTGSSAGSNGATSTATANISVASVSGTVGVFVTDILDYANTTKYKTYKSLTGYDNNGSGVIAMRSVLWMNTGAVTSLSLKFDTGVNFAQNTRFSLYGIRG
jgi:hypothetical protein